MATAVASLPQQVSTDAEFRAWAQSISNAFAAFGWVKTADTGQVDLTTVVKPAAANTAAGYEVWRMADALQASAPVFLKIEYGTGSAVANPGFWATTGTASSGAGAVTGFTSSRRTCTSFGTTTAAVANSHYSGATDRMGISVYTGSTIGPHFSVERTKDSAGNNTAEGVVVSSMQAGGTSQEAVVQFAAPTGEQASSSSMWSFAGLGSGVSGLDIGLQPVFWYTPLKGLAGPKLAHVTYWNADIPVGTTFTTTLAGAAHTYISIGQPGGGNSFAARGTNNTSIGLAMRFE